jgi:hypothetical protein
MVSLVSLRLNILRALALGFVYGMIEYFFVYPALGGLYRFLYIALLVLPFVNLNGWVWMADSAFAMTIQDSSYWVVAYLLTRTLPWQWAWYYPVFSHVPLLYFVSVPLVIYAYCKAKSLPIRSFIRLK